MTAGYWIAIGVIVVINVLCLTVGARWSSRQLRRKVFDALDGHQFDVVSWDVGYLAVWLAKYEYGFKGYEPKELVPYVREWLSKVSQEKLAKCPGCDGYECDAGCRYPGACPAP